MKINLVSDLHINVADITLPGGDVLIVAGDTLEIAHIRLAETTGRNVFLADRYKRFITEEFAKYRHVVYICGNHEYYHGYFDTEHERLQAILPDNVHYLENQSVEIDGIHFWGATMWTNMHGGNPFTMETVQNGLNDFRLIKFENSHHKHGYWTNKFSVRDAMKEYNYSVQQLTNFLKDHENNQVVVVAHHAPSALSVNPKYAEDYHLNGGYHNHLETLILDNPQIKLMVHGHMHDSVRYYIGDTLIACNPRGYAGYEKSAENYTSKEIDLNNMPSKDTVENDKLWLTT
jgi:Icc-related predicted phosphoesterase